MSFQILNPTGSALPCEEPFLSVIKIQLCSVGSFVKKKANRPFVRRIQSKTPKKLQPKKTWTDIALTLIIPFSILARLIYPFDLTRELLQHVILNLEKGAIYAET